MIENHALLLEFPEHKERIHSLKLGNHHFAKLFDEYHDVDHHIRRIEQELETPHDPVVENLKKQRLQLKDKLYQLIQQQG